MKNIKPLPRVKESPSALNTTGTHTPVESPSPTAHHAPEATLSQSPSTTRRAARKEKESPETRPKSDSNSRNKFPVYKKRDSTSNTDSRSTERNRDYETGAKHLVTSYDPPRHYGRLSGLQRAAAENTAKEPLFREG